MIGRVSRISSRVAWLSTSTIQMTRRSPAHSQVHHDPGLLGVERDGGLARPAGDEVLLGHGRAVPQVRALGGQALEVPTLELRR